jgi:hypothetical protein
MIPTTATLTRMSHAFSAPHEVHPDTAIAPRPGSAPAFDIPELDWWRISMDGYIPGSLSDADFEKRYVRRPVPTTAPDTSRPIAPRKSAVKRGHTSIPAEAMDPAEPPTAVSAGGTSPRVTWDVAITGFGFAVGAVLANRAGAIAAGIAAYLWARRRR